MAQYFMGFLNMNFVLLGALVLVTGLLYYAISILGGRMRRPRVTAAVFSMASLAAWAIIGGFYIRDVFFPVESDGFFISPLFRFITGNDDLLNSRACYGGLWLCLIMLLLSAGLLIHAVLRRSKQPAGQYGTVRSSVQSKAI